MVQLMWSQPAINCYFGTHAVFTTKELNACVFWLLIPIVQVIYINFTQHKKYTYISHHLSSCYNLRCLCYSIGMNKNAVDLLFV